MVEGCSCTGGPAAGGIAGGGGAEPIVGVAVLHEAMPPERWLGFAIVWLALVILSVDMIVAAKIFIVVVWMGAGVSKLQHGFSSTVAIMVQNTPWNGFRKFRMATVRDYPNDIRPSTFTHLLAHIGGTTAEIVMPLQHEAFGDVCGVAGPAGQPVYLLQLAADRPSRSVE